MFVIIIEIFILIVFGQITNGAQAINLRSKTVFVLTQVITTYFALSNASIIC